LKYPVAGLCDDEEHLGSIISRNFLSNWTTWLVKKDFLSRN